MLPAVSRTLTAAVTALAVTVSTLAPAHAIGKNERNFLKGVAAAAIVGAVINEAGKSQAAPVYNQPQYREPQYNGHRHREQQYRQQQYRQPQYQQPRRQTATVTSQAFNEFSPQARRAIQQRLRSYGYYTGGIDGVWGRGTSAAIEAYARRVNSTDSLYSRDGTVTLLNSLLS